MDTFKDRSRPALGGMLDAADSPESESAITYLSYIPKRQAAAPRPRALTLQAGFIPPCLPMTAPSPPAGRLWLHEVKHDGVRVIARHDGRQVKLYGRSGEDLTVRYPLIGETMARLPPCTIDGEAIACDENGMASFDLLQRRMRDERVFLYAFDLIEVNGDDRRRDGLVHRKLDLTRLVAKAGPGVLVNEWAEGGECDAAAVFAQACAVGLEGVVWKRKDSRYISGKSPYWLMMKNPQSAAVRRQNEDNPGSPVL